MNALFSRREYIADNVHMFWFTPQQTFEYQPGQFIELTLPHFDVDSRGQKRWFTIATCPAEGPQIAILTRLPENKSTFKQTLDTLVAGEQVAISQAMGDFVLPIQSNTPVFFVSYGIGVSPVRSIVADIAASPSARSVQHLHITDKKNAPYFKELFENHCASYEVLARDRANVPKLIQDFYRQEPLGQIYISGPEKIVEDVTNQLTQTIPNHQIVTDYFHGYEA